MVGLISCVRRVRKVPNYPSTHSLPTHFSVKLPLMGIGWNIVVVLSVFSAQLYTFVTEYLGSILSGGSGKNGSTIAVSGLGTVPYQHTPDSLPSACLSLMALLKPYV